MRRKMSEKPQSAEEMVLYAWVGADDTPPFIPGREFGLKQARVPAGMIPMVACKEEKMLQQYIIDQMRVLARRSGIPRQFVKFTFEKVIMEVTG
jgi:hypothetical protein